MFGSKEMQFTGNILTLNNKRNLKYSKAKVNKF